MGDGTAIEGGALGRSVDGGRAAADADEWTRLAIDAAGRYGTPCYVSRWRPVIDRVLDLERRVAPPVRSWLSFKTHPLPSLARAWASTGRGVEVTSECETAAATSAGCPSDLLLVNGVAKHSWLTRRSFPGLRVHLDSATEAQALAGIAARNRWRVGLRCQVPAERDRDDARFRGPFGLSRGEVQAVAARLRSAGVAIEGMHFHLGQGRRQPADYGESVDYVARLCRENRLFPRYIDCGGGFDDALDVQAAVAELNAAFARARRAVPSLEELWMENGRYVTAASAALVVRVLDVKVRAECRYLICDGGRTNQALDADNRLHPLLVVPTRAGADVLTTVAGPTCMTDDRLGRVMLPDTVQSGDLIVWLEAGAYHLPWETRFSHGWCAVAWQDGTGALSLVRARETPEQWTSSWLG